MYIRKKNLPESIMFEIYDTSFKLWLIEYLCHQHKLQCISHTAECSLETTCVVKPAGTQNPSQGPTNSPTVLFGQKMNGLQKLAAGLGVAVSQWHAGKSGEITEIMLPVVLNGPDIQMLLSSSRKISVISTIPNSSTKKLFLIYNFFFV